MSCDCGTCRHHLTTLSTSHVQPRSKHLTCYADGLHGVLFALQATRLVGCGRTSVDRRCSSVRSVCGSVYEFNASTSEERAAWDEYNFLWVRDDISTTFSPCALPPSSAAKWCACCLNQIVRFQCVKRRQRGRSRANALKLR